MQIVSRIAFQGIRDFFSGTKILSRLSISSSHISPFAMGQTTTRSASASQSPAVELAVPLDATNREAVVGEYILNYNDSTLDTHHADYDAIVVAVHGAPGSVRDFRYVAGAFDASASAATVRLVRLDMPGHGDSRRADGQELDGTENLGQLLVDFVRWLEPSKPVILMGHSMGAHVCLRAAGGSPHLVSGIALVNPIGLRPHKGISPLWLSQSISVPLLWPLVGQWWGDVVLRNIYLGLLGFSPRTSTPEICLSSRKVRTISFQDATADARAIAAEGIPSLVAWSSQDHLVEEDISVHLAGALPAGPRLAYNEGGPFSQKHHAIDIVRALAGMVAEQLPVFQADREDAADSE
jgi:pimeloyl-ACP methyl ester carboxylesterase